MNISNSTTNVTDDVQVQLPFIYIANKRLSTRVFKQIPHITEKEIDKGTWTAIARCNTRWKGDVLLGYVGHPGDIYWHLLLEDQKGNLRRLLLFELPEPAPGFWPQPSAQDLSSRAYHRWLNARWDEVDSRYMNFAGLATHHGNLAANLPLRAKRHQHAEQRDFYSRQAEAVDQQREALIQAYETGEDVIARHKQLVKLARKTQLRYLA